MVGPMLDYAGIMRGGMNLVPNLRDQLIEDSLLKMQKTEFEQAQQDRVAQAQAAAEAKAREGEFQSALEEAMLTGDPRKIQALRFRFPEFTKGMKDAFDAMDADVRRSNLTQIGSIFARLQSGDAKGAADILRRRIQDDKAAGEDTAEDEQILAEMESGDPARVRAASAVIGIQLAAVEPDKFGETYGKLNPTEAKPSIQKEAEYYRSIGRNDLAEQILTNNADPLVQITGPSGVNVLPRSVALGGSMAPQGAQPAAQGGGDPSGSGAGMETGSFWSFFDLDGPQGAVERTKMQPVRVRSQQDVAALPRGARFIDPRDGVTVREKP